jgi:hypothetical protein
MTTSTGQSTTKSSRPATIAEQATWAEIAAGLRRGIDDQGKQIGKLAEELKQSRRDFLKLARQFDVARRQEQALRSGISRAWAVRDAHAANVKMAHRALDAAGIPDARGAAYDDPERQSLLVHRIKSLTAEVCRLRSLKFNVRKWLTLMGDMAYGYSEDYEIAADALVAVLEALDDD